MFLQVPQRYFVFLDKQNTLFNKPCAGQRIHYCAASHGFPLRLRIQLRRDQPQGTNRRVLPVQRGAGFPSQCQRKLRIAAHQNFARVLKQSPSIRVAHGQMGLGCADDCGLRLSGGAGFRFYGGCGCRGCADRLAEPGAGGGDAVDEPDRAVAGGCCVRGEDGVLRLGGLSLGGGGLPVGVGLAQRLEEERANAHGDNRQGRQCQSASARAEAPATLPAAAVNVFDLQLRWLGFAVACAG